jgi:hypothetical protein
MILLSGVRTEQFLQNTLITRASQIHFHFSVRRSAKGIKFVSGLQRFSLSLLHARRCLRKSLLLFYNAFSHTPRRFNCCGAASAAECNAADEKKGNINNCKISHSALGTLDIHYNRSTITVTESECSFTGNFLNLCSAKVICMRFTHSLYTLCICTHARSQRKCGQRETGRG